MQRQSIIAWKAVVSKSACEYAFTNRNELWATVISVYKRYDPIQKEKRLDMRVWLLNMRTKIQWCFEDGLQTSRAYINIVTGTGTGLSYRRYKCPIFIGLNMSLDILNDRFFYAKRKWPKEQLDSGRDSGRAGNLTLFITISTRLKYRSSVTNVKIRKGKDLFG